MPIATELSPPLPPLFVGVWTVVGAGRPPYLTFRVGPYKEDDDNGAVVVVWGTAGRGSDVPIDRGVVDPSAAVSTNVFVPLATASARTSTLSAATLTIPTEIMVEPDMPSSPSSRAKLPSATDEVMDDAICVLVINAGVATLVTTRKAVPI